MTNKQKEKIQAWFDIMQTEHKVRKAIDGDPDTRELAMIAGAVAMLKILEPALVENL